MSTRPTQYSSPRTAAAAAAAARRRGPAAAFTLIEIMIVVIILGILAAIAVPQMTVASTEARETVLRDELRHMRGQLFIYRTQHYDVSAGYPNGNTAATPDEATLLDQLTKHTSVAGAVSDTASDVYKYPPYLVEVPVNPLSKKNRVWVVAAGDAMPAADETQPYGWIYNPQTNRIVANLEGSDLRNVPFANY